jgi:hypothetical protein
MRRRALRIALVVVAGLVILGAAFVWALPEIVRRVALNQIPERTGRAVAIEDVDLNLFTGRVAIAGLRLGERDGGGDFVTLERVSLRLSLPALMRSEIRLSEVAVVAPSVRVVRTEDGQFNFSDLIPPPAPTPPAEAPSAWVMTLDRLAVSRGTIEVHDRAVAPPSEWKVQDLGVEAADLTTRAGAAPGRLAVQGKIDEASLGVTAERVRLEPVQVAATISLTDFQVRRTTPYAVAPLGLAYGPSAGRLTVKLQVDLDSDAGEVKRASVSGTASLDGQALVATGQQAPFVQLSRLAVNVKEVDALARTATIESVTIDGLDLRARRDARGAIDLVDMLMARKASAGGAPGSAAAPASSVPAPVGSPSAPAAVPPRTAAARTLASVVRDLARGMELIRVERVVLGPSTVTVVDESVKPTTTLGLTNLQATVTGITWPPKAPADLALSTALPGGGTLQVKGPVLAQPLDADLAFTLRNAPVAPYQAYIPVPARLSGRFNGDSRNRIALKDGAMVLASKGNSWADDVEIRAPGGDRPVIRVPRMDLAGIDVDWPKRAAVARAAFRRLAVEVERGADGTINLRRLFAEPDGPAAKPAPDAKPAPASAPAPPARPAPAGDAPKGLLETMAIDVKEVRVEQGFIRFLDRTTTPAFSQDLSRLELTVAGLSNRAGQRARLALTSMVGGDAALDVRGEIGPIGAPAFADVVGELRAFKLASVDPYAEAAIGWVIKQGDLQYKVRFKLDGDRLDATNDIVVGQLQVAPASGGDEVKKRLGLPLGLIVALIKDGKGEIRANVPVTGSLNDPQFSLRETIWTAIKNVLVNIVKAPFRAISRLFSGGDKLEEPKVDPVTFAAGSSVLAPDMEEHLIRVADFLRRSPFVNLSLAPAPGAADAEALKAEAVRARLAEFQKARGLKDAPATVAAYFKEHLPDVKPPATLDEQLAVLREREPVPEAALAELARRRLEATRDRLVNVEGVPAARLTVAEASAEGAKADAAGGVRFAVVTP